MRLFDSKPMIVAEIGSNFETFEQAVASIGAAKAAGADACKFQLFHRSAMYGFTDGNDALTLPLDWLPKLAEKARACRIDFACTAFSPELVAAVDPYVAWHKVASSDATWPQLLAAVAKTGKPVVLSTGAKSNGDIARAITTLVEAGVDGDRLIPLYCVASYPARTVDLRVMERMQEVITGPIGFSDHTRDIIGHPVEAARRGAVLIEKHFTAFPELDTPDRPHSLDPGEFRTMVEHIRGIRQPVIGPTPEERDMLLRHNRRLVATRDVAAGERLTYGNNFGAYRSLKDDTRGLSPFAWQQVEGGIAAKPIARGDAIGPGDFA